MTKEIRLPVSEAFHISLEHLRKRRTRSIIMIASTGLGISYFTYFLTTNTIINYSLGRPGEAVEAYHSWLIAVSIFICGISLVNSTMISVLERYREIGTMKCLGALDKHVLEFLLIEAFFLGLAGGLVGFAFGTVASILSCYFEFGFGVLKGLSMIWFSSSLGQIVLLSVVLSILSTAYPALRAAKLNPVEALRYDV